jgi:hypothetical protein
VGKYISGSFTARNLSKWADYCSQNSQVPLGCVSKPGPALTENTVPKQLTPWKPGQSGNPAGRPKGSRNRLSEDFVCAFADDFAEYGVEVIEKVRRERPSDYLKIAASLLPKDLEVTLNSNLQTAGILAAAATFSEAYAIARSVITGDVVEAEIVQDD